MKYGLLVVTSVAALTLSGCDRLDAAWKAFENPNGSAGQPAPAEPAAPAPTTPLTPTGHGLPVKAQPEAELQYPASVVEVHPLAEITGMDGKIFGTAGGDPAMNGLQTYIAFYRSPAEGWWIYQIGDFLSFRILNQSRGQVDLEVQESVMNEATGEIGSRTRRIIVAFVVEPAEEHPVNVRFQPAA